MTDAATDATAEPLSARQRAILISAWALMALLAMFVPAANDDWFSASPILDFSWALLLPKERFWRPLETLFRAGLGLVPSGFPLLNHLAVAAGHACAAGVVASILRQLGARVEASVVTVLVFLMSPAVAATVFSVDGLNQAWSLVFGLAGLRALMGPLTAARVGSWVLWCAIAVFTKESALVFFAIGPVFAAAVRAHRAGMALRAWRPTAREFTALLIGVTAAVAYLGVRTWLVGVAGTLPDEGRYVPNLAPASLLRNLVLLVGLSVSTVDTLAVFLTPANWLWAGVSAAAGLPMLAMFGRRLLPARMSASIWLGVTMVGLGSLLSVVIDHPAEMHAYQTLGLLCLCVGFGAPDRPRVRAAFATAAVVLFLWAAAAVDMHKCLSMVAYGRSSEVITATIDRQTTGPRPSSVCVVCRHEFWEGSGNGYSIYSQPPEWASYWGLSVRARWGWRTPERFTYCRPGWACDASCDATWVFSENGQVVVRRGPALVNKTWEEIVAEEGPAPQRGGR